MNDRDLFALALGLTNPWFVSSVELDAERKKLELSIDFERGSAFPWPECGAAGCKAYDTEQRWVVAASELLRVRDSPCRANGESALRQVRDASGGRPVGAAGQRLHACSRR
ncbi:MAG TPA: hypothetical protein VGF48_00680 [Thermoanaerobaculia bacterium]|jgi:hypothetical protein